MQRLSRQACPHTARTLKAFLVLQQQEIFFLPKFGVWRCMLQLLSRRYNVIAAVLMHEWSETRCSVKVTIDECSPFWIELLPTTGPGWWVGSWIITLENVELVWSKWNNDHWIFFVGLCHVLGTLSTRPFICSPAGGVRKRVVLIRAYPFSHGHVM